MLSKPDILRYLKQNKLRLNPQIEEDQVAQVSIDLRLGRKFTVFKRPRYLPAIHVDKSLFTSADLWEHREGKSYRLEPNRMVLAQTLEKIWIPNDLVGFVEGRSSWARLGVTVHVTAPKLDPGFEATITLEMVNFGRVPIDLRAVVDRPAQVMFFKLSAPLRKEQLYGASAGDVFQYQEDPIPRRRTRK